MTPDGSPDDDWYCASAAEAIPGEGVIGQLVHKILSQIETDREREEQYPMSVIW